MPKWTRNIVRATGIGELSIYTEGKYGPELNFNLIIPMPEELNVEAGYLETASLRYLKYRTKNVLDRKTYSKSLSISEKTMDAIQHDIDNIGEEKLLESGLRYMENIARFGYATWYDWCIVNWGTKWNAETVIIESDRIEFDTAWCAPEPIMMKLSEMYPDIEFDHAWQDEDMYGSGGRGTWKNGRFIGDECESNLDLYVECWGEDERIGIDENGNYYVIEED